MMTTPVVLSAIVGGGVSFLVTILVSFCRDLRGRKHPVSESTHIWE